MSAPGVDVLTTSKGGGYQKVSGTSASAAFVTGVAGLIETAHISLPGSHIKDTIIKQARVITALADKNKAGGILNASDTVVAAKKLFKTDGDTDSGGQSNVDATAAERRLSTAAKSVEPPLNPPTVNRRVQPIQPKAPDPIPSTLLPLDQRNLNGDIGPSQEQDDSSTDQSGQFLSSISGGISSGSTPDGGGSVNRFERLEQAIGWNMLVPYFKSSNSSYSAFKSSAPFYSTSDNFSEERLDPANRIGGGGEDIFSGNFNWGIGLVGLKGRAGLDLSIGLSYNSLVWTKSGSTIAFDADHGLPTPGFRLGFPVIEPSFSSSVSGATTFLMIAPSGARTEFRFVSTSGSSFYESADSSYSQLIDTHDGSLTVVTAGGTRMTYTLHNSTGYDCTQIKDRNGNYITINYDSYRHISTIVDTLNRTITFNYDTNHNPTSISQSWAGTSRNWATFGYTTKTISTNFTSLTLSGITNGTTINVLHQVGLADGSYVQFEYTSWGQVYQITNYAADNHELSQIIYNLPLTNGTAATDCPRFTQRTDYAENWNSGSTVTTSFSVTSSASWTKLDTTSDSGTLEQTTTPDGTIYKTYSHSSGWDKGLPRLQETWSDSSTKQRSVYTDYTQDNTSLSYILNPRVTETNITDSSNRKRNTISYTSFTLPDGATVHLPSDSYEYLADASTVLRQSHTDYITGSSYLSWHILGLPSAQYVYDASSTVYSHTGYSYDDSAQISTQTAVQHDDTNYSTSFLTRGNVDKIIRYDKTTTSTHLDTTITYNTDGSVLSTTDPASHTSSISYTDSFSDSTNHSTYAYPTTVTDADSNSSTVIYNYDFGGVTKTSNPLGAQQIMTYDSAGRLYQQTNHDTADRGYTYYVYSSAQNEVVTHSLLSAGGTETYSETLTDGAGRIYRTRTDHVGSTGGYKGQKIFYDTMGRVSQKSNPTEISVSGSTWTPAGDDATGGWAYTTQTYDWKG